MEASHVRRSYTFVRTWTAGIFEGEDIAYDYAIIYFVKLISGAYLTYCSTNHCICTLGYRNCTRMYYISYKIHKKLFDNVIVNMVKTAIFIISCRFFVKTEPQAIFFTCTVSPNHDR